MTEHEVYVGDCRDVLATLPDASVQTVVTSPPYYGLRDYQTGTWEGGDPACDHHAPSRFDYALNAGLGPTGSQTQASNAGSNGATQYRDICGKCGARRVDRQIGMEQSPQAYVAALVDVFRAVRRVLRDDGTVWLNLGDSFAGLGVGGNPAKSAHRKQATNTGSLIAGHTAPPGFKPKDLMLIPHRVAIALCDDGWYVRGDIVWAKPSCMPESVRDRPTRSHEYVFLLAKRERYFYDATAIAEPATEPERRRWDRIGGANGHTVRHSPGHMIAGSATRNRRDVWTLNSEPFRGAHFATFPTALVEPCILAGTSARGCCPLCGAPWRRVVARGGADHDAETGTRYPAGSQANRLALLRQAARKRGAEYAAMRETVGWEPTCACGTHDTIPCTVLDPFCGSGTTGVVARRLGRAFVGIELSAEYAAMARQRITGTQPPLLFDRHSGEEVSA